jgi:metal-responsive CopG/Arc/MetJ family transcriptional regulator
MSNPADWKKSVSVSLPPDLLTRLDECVDASRLIQSRSALARVALEDYLDQREAERDEARRPQHEAA